MISGDKALDMLPYVVDIYEKADFEKTAKRLKDKNKNLDQKAMGIELFKYIAKNNAKIRNELFSICSIIEDKSVEEIRKRSIFKTFKVLKDEFSDNNIEELASFFKDAI